MAQAKAFVSKAIQDNSVAVFSKSYCPYCRSAKDLLTTLGARYTAYEIDQLPDGAAMQDALEEISGQRTVPNIYISQQHIGGNSDLQRLGRDGKLKGMLEKAGALAA